MNQLAIHADELKEAAHIIRSQLPHTNHIWISSMISQNIGSDASHLVQDIQHVEDQVVITRQPCLILETAKVPGTHRKQWATRFTEADIDNVT